MVDGQISLFQISGETMRRANETDSLPQAEDYPKSARMAMEKEMLGLYLTGHPLADNQDLIDKISTVTTEEIAHFQENPRIRDEMEVLMVGIISHKKTKVTRNNKMMAFLNVEDMVGGVEILVFPNVFERCAPAIFEDAVVVVRGRLNYKEDETPKIIAEKITPISVAEAFYRKKSMIS
jgi:DNA polymerase-3 subunit alpha